MKIPPMELLLAVPDIGRRFRPAVHGDSLKVSHLVPKCSRMGIIKRRMTAAVTATVPASANKSDSESGSDSSSISIEREKEEQNEDAEKGKVSTSRVSPLNTPECDLGHTELHFLQTASPRRHRVEIPKMTLPFQVSSLDSKPTETRNLLEPKPSLRLM